MWRSWGGYYLAVCFADAPYLGKNCIAYIFMCYSFSLLGMYSDRLCRCCPHGYGGRTPGEKKTDLWLVFLSVFA